MWFRPFPLLQDTIQPVKSIESHIQNKNYELADSESRKLIQLCLDGLYYFQTYDWAMLMTVISLGYAGWIIYVFLHVLRYSSSSGIEHYGTKKEQKPAHYSVRTEKI